jgi:glycosyltransferase involved in cell wall biosynthesis
VSTELVKSRKAILGIEEHEFVLGYLGAIGTWYMMDEMLLFFRALLKQMPQSHFLFITHESSETIYQKCSELDISKNRVHVVKAERNEVPSWLKTLSASIFFIKPAFSKKASSPTKQGEIMSMGIPLICNSQVGDTDHIVNHYKSGYVVTDFSNDSFSGAIEYLQNYRQTPEEIERIRKGAIDFFSLENGVEKYAEVYRKLLQ